VLFTQATQSACGGASSAVGPHYCPPDQTVYLDLAFFRELRDRFGASGDFAHAYVIAHEVGHHVQNELGIMDRVENREDGIRLELQADCLAGVWGYTAEKRGLLDPGDTREALDAAAAVGDDRIQQQTQGPGHAGELDARLVRAADEVVHPRDEQGRPRRVRHLQRRDLETLSSEALARAGAGAAGPPRRSRVADAAEDGVLLVVRRLDDVPLA
jgi:hypothetical protein